MLFGIIFIYRINFLFFPLQKRKYEINFFKILWHYFLFCRAKKRQLLLSIIISLKEILFLIFYNVLKCLGESLLSKLFFKKIKFYRRSKFKFVRFFNSFNPEPKEESPASEISVFLFFEKLKSVYD